MNYEKMWKSLKKTINEETDILSEEKKKASSSILVDDLEAQYNEADYIIGIMEEIEASELLLQERESSEVKE